MPHDRLEETYSLADLAIRFALSPSAVSTVITGIRTPEQAKLNTRVSQLPPLDERALEVLSRHNWLRGVWYGGK